MVSALRYKAHTMKTLDRLVAAAELLLISPAALFMTALFVRNLSPKTAEPAMTAQRVVMLYASNVHVGLWLLLVGMPLAALGIGCATLLRQWSDDAALRQAVISLRAHFATLLIALATVASAGFLGAIGIHVLTD
jgi:hypothetical protein